MRGKKRFRRIQGARQYRPVQSQRPVEDTQDHDDQVCRRVRQTALNSSGYNQN